MWILYRCIKLIWWHFSKNNSESKVCAILFENHLSTTRSQQSVFKISQTNLLPFSFGAYILLTLWPLGTTHALTLNDIWWQRAGIFAFCVCMTARGGAKTWILLFRIKIHRSITSANVGYVDFQCHHKQVWWNQQFRLHRDILWCCYCYFCESYH